MAMIDLGSASANRTEVNEYHVFPPKGAVFEQTEIVARLKAHMNERWPDLVFKVADAQGLRHDDLFSVIPMVGRAGDAHSDSDAMFLLPMPPESLLRDLQAWADRFDPYAVAPLLN